jgi:sulfotransferase family protein
MNVVAGDDWRPNLFVVGAPRCATTWLHESLAAHPDVFMSSNKEPHYFAESELEARRMAFFKVVRDESAYSSLFAGGVGRTVRGESSTSYLASAVAAERIARFNSQARIVATLRDPVERAYSHYLTDVREGLESRTFLEAVRDELEGPAAWPAVYVESGRYHGQVVRYLDRFAQRVLILVFEDLAAAPEQAILRVLDFLGVDPAVSPDPRAASTNAYARARTDASKALLGSPAIRRLARAVVPPGARGVVRRWLVAPDAKPPMDEQARRLLTETYRRDVESLEQLLDRRLPWLDGRSAARG